MTAGAGEDEPEETRILEYVNTIRSPQSRPVTDPRLDLIAAGLIDSISMLEIIVWLDEAFGVRVPNDDIRPQNLGSVAAMAEYVRRARTAV
ncbi:MAG: acyl carrier protein [Planctomycetota bacterium]